MQEGGRKSNFRLVFMLTGKRGMGGRGGPVSSAGEKGKRKKESRRRLDSEGSQEKWGGGD